MGGVPAPQAMAFPSASEPNPIANGLRGQGPMQIIDQTIPPAAAPTTPTSSPQTPQQPAGPSGPVGTPVYTGWNPGASLVPVSKNYVTPDAMFFPTGTNVPMGYTLEEYISNINNPPQGSLDPNNPNVSFTTPFSGPGSGGVYQWTGGNTFFQAPGAAQQYYSLLAQNGINPAYSLGTTPEVTMQGAGAGPAFLPFIMNQNQSQLQNNPYAGYYTGSAYGQSPNYLQSTPTQTYPPFAVGA